MNPQSAGGGTGVVADGETDNTGLNPNFSFNSNSNFTHRTNNQIMTGEPSKRANPRMHDNTDLRGLNNSDTGPSRTETSVPRAPSVASTTGSFKD